LLEIKSNTKKIQRKSNTKEIKYKGNSKNYMSLNSLIVHI